MYPYSEFQWKYKCSEVPTNGLIDESHYNYVAYKILVKLFSFSKKKKKI